MRWMEAGESCYGKTGADDALTKHIRNRTLSFDTDLPWLPAHVIISNIKVFVIVLIYICRHLSQVTFELHAKIKGKQFDMKSS